MNDNNHENPSPFGHENQGHPAETAPVPVALPWIVGSGTVGALALTVLLPQRWQLLAALVVFLYGPHLVGMIPSLRVTQVHWDRTIQSLLSIRRGVTRQFGVAVINMAIVFPLFAAVFYVWQRWGRQLPFSPQFPSWEILLQQLAINLFVVALSEELFFRGYLTRLFEASSVPSLKRIEAATNDGLTWLPTRADLWANVFFAVVHVATYQEPVRMIVFFPGLWYASLRRQSGGYFAPIVAHGLSNVLMNALLGIA